MITDIAQAVTDELNGGSFSLGFTAERKAVPMVKLSEMDSLHVTVVPREVESAALDRTRDSHEVKVDIAVQQRVASLENDDIDPLMALVREIADFLNRRNVGGPAGAGWKKTENKPVYSPEHLREMKQFTGVLTLTYQVTR